MTKKIDKRILKTRAAIIGALEALLQEKTYSEITVTAIAKKANVDRKTFYTHYSSIDNLLEDVARKNVDEILSDLTIDSFFKDYEDSVLKLYRNANAVIENTTLASSKNNVSFHNETIVKFVSDALKAHLKDSISDSEYLKAHPIPEQDIDFMLSFFIGGFVSAYNHWIKSDHSMTLENLAVLTSACTARGLAVFFER